MTIIKPKTALISLSDKSNLEIIINFLVEKSIKIIPLDPIEVSKKFLNRFNFLTKGIN